MKQSFIKITKWFLGISLGLFILITALLYFYQDKICNLVVKELAKELAAPVNYSKFELSFWSSFPQLSVDIHQVHVKDAFSKHKSNGTLLKSERIRMSFNPFDLWKGDYHIKVFEVSPGELNIKIAADGDVNYQIMKETQNQEETKYKLKISSFVLNQVKLNYLNNATHQHYQSYIRNVEINGDFDQEKFIVNAKGDLLLKRLKSGEITMLKNQPVAFDFELKVNNKIGIIELPKANLLIANLPFVTQGKFTNDSLQFNIKSKDIQLTELVNSLSISEAKDQMDEFKGKGMVDFNLDLNGGMAATDPLFVNCNFAVKNGELLAPFKNIKIKNIQVKGDYKSNGDQSEEQLSLNNFKFSTSAGPFQGNIKIKDFNTPKISGNAMGCLDLHAVNAVAKIDEIEKINGIAKVNSSFAMIMENSIHVSHCNGTVDLKNIWFKIKEDKRTFEKINGSVALQGSSLSVKGATVSVSDSDMKLDGSFQNIYNYLAGKGNLETQLSINSSSINLADLGTTSKSEKIASKGKSFTLPNDILGEVYVSAGSIKYEKHIFENVKGLMEIHGRKLSFPNISLKNAQADIDGNINIDEKSPEKFFITANLGSKNLYFKPLFKEWDNFDQTVINSEQISGRAEANVFFYAPFDLIGGINLDAIESKIHMKVFNGHLKNVESFNLIVESMRTNAGKLLIGKKNIDLFESKLKDISFQTLENELIIHHGRIDIPTMHINSSAMELDISGSHSFMNQIDYRIMFKLREILGEDKDSEFGKVLDDDTGLKIYLRMYGDLDDPNIDWDKTSRKQQAQQSWMEEKQEVKSILKSEFGFYKNDSLVKEVKNSEKPKEIIKVKFNSGSTTPQKEKVSVPPSEPKKDTKLKGTLNQWKQQQNQSQTVISVKKG